MKYNSNNLSLYIDNKEIKLDEESLQYNLDLNIFKKIEQQIFWQNINDDLIKLYIFENNIFCASFIICKDILKDFANKYPDNYLWNFDYEVIRFRKT